MYAVDGYCCTVSFLLVIFVQYLVCCKEMLDIHQRIIEWKRFLFPRLTTQTTFAHYIPMVGAVSHSLYSMHILSPDLLSRYFGAYDLAAEFSILCTATLGPGFAVYFRPHMNRLGYWKRIEYSVFAAVMFTYGSLFAIIFLKDMLPNALKVWMKSLIGAGMSLILLSRGYNYLKFHDSLLKYRSIGIHSTPKKSVTTSSHDEQ
ncbi:ATP-dependent helicase/nuclease subunit [Dirofilaria immitis]